MNPTAALITQQNGFTPKPNSQVCCLPVKEDFVDVGIACCVSRLTPFTFQVQPMTNGISSGGLKQTVNSKVSPTAQPLNLSGEQKPS